MSILTFILSKYFVNINNGYPQLLLKRLLIAFILNKSIID